MSQTISLPLRILYTINGSPQYILARSLSSFSVQLVAVAGSSTDIKHTYGTVSLKTCLDTICRSSPELLQDRTRDYSVYVLDPLESVPAPPPVHTLDRRGYTEALQQRGVAVGLGLMSWALLSEESKSLPIAGTLINPGNGRQALEVIFALRETPAVNLANGPTPHVPLEVTSNDHPSETVSANPGSSTSRPQSKSNKPLLSPLSLAKARAKGLLNAQPPPKTKAIERAMSEADLILESSITYIGPPKKKGRPAKSALTSNSKVSQTRAPTSAEVTSSIPSPDTNMRESSLPSSSQPVCDIDRSLSPELPQTNAPSPTQFPSAQSSKPSRRARSKNDLPSPFVTGPLVRKPQEERPQPPPPPPTLLDVLSALSTSNTSHLPETQNAALLNALSAIDSQHGSRSTSNPALVSALKQLISAAVTHRDLPVQSGGQTCRAARYPHNQSTAPSETPSQASSPAKSQDDDIVILDKENVNPTAFRRRAERERAEAKLLFLTDQAQPSSRPAEASDTVARSGLGTAHDLGNRMQSGTTPETSSPSHYKIPIQAESSTRKRRLSDLMDERDSARKRVGHRDAHRYPRRSELGETSNPMRHYARLANPDSSTSQNIAGPSTSPLRNERHYERHFWDEGEVRTDSSLSRAISIVNSPKRGRVLSTSASSPIRPSASHVVQRKKYVVPEWARTNTVTQPRLSEDALKSMVEKRDENGQKGSGKRAKSKAGRQAQQSALSRTSSTREAPKTPEESSLEANDGTTASPPSRHLSQVPPSVPVTANTACPVFGGTGIAFPTRTRTPSPRSSSTEMPVTPPRRLSGSFSMHDASFFTPTPKAMNPNGGHFGSPLFSPFGALGSPVPKSSIWGKMVGTQDPGSSQRQSETDEEDESMIDALSQELDEALEEKVPDPDSPPDSLPIASSDTECEDSTSSHYDTDLDGYPVKQHWDGLPPSSPPPPSSPAELPQSLPLDSIKDDSLARHLDFDIPVPSSETDEDDSSRTAIPPEDTATTPSLSPKDLGLYFDLNDFETYFSNVNNAPQSTEMGSMSDGALFKQFTHLTSQPDDFLSQGGPLMDMPADPGTSNNLADIDFTELWQSMKPLVDANYHPVYDGSGATVEASMGVGLNIPSHSQPLTTESVDHEKLAEEVHALFSGCLM